MSYWRLFYHFTWGTKYRQDLIDPAYEENLYRLITTKAQQLGAQVFAIGGTANHVHLVVSVPPNLALTKFIGQVKGFSSHVINAEFHPEIPFAWQHQFGVLSLGGKQLDMLVNYVLHQKEHHAEKQLISGLEADR
ncbi:MAG: IS200/IS605 family transposase [Anaerolineales bacterium]|nr:IS200/IS605 family transposase [Anaerolineales bacterium]